MIILPDRNIPRAKLLLPIPKHQWRTPSQAQPKDQFGNENRTRFRVRAKLNDGFIKWVGWFDDREDFDRFLWAIADGSLWNDQYIQQLPTPFWPGLDPLITYDFASLTFLTTTASSPVTSASDWNNSNNTVECIGGGASGPGSRAASNVHAGGGGGGSYSKITNFSFAVPGTTQATYAVGAAVAGTSLTSTGNNGNPTWFNNATDPGTGSDNTKCSAKGGTGGNASSTTGTGGAGGVTGTSWGQTKNAGGNGGSMTGVTGRGSAGGGGAAGPAGVGGNGVDSSSTGADVMTAGGTGNNGTDLGGTTGGNVGASGTEFDGSHGCGGGGGGNSASSGNVTGGAGGNYGGGGSGATCNSGLVPTGGGGIQGLIILTSTPVTSSGFNMPMLGM